MSYFRSVAALGAILAVANTGRVYVNRPFEVPDLDLDHRPNRPRKQFRLAEQTGPVIDTTPLSKRAKRRMRARGLLP